MKILAAAALLTVLLPTVALAWGNEGHEVIAALAYENLTPAARDQVDTLLRHAPEQQTPMCPANTFEGAATWPDCVRGKDHRFDALSPDHFEDRPLCGPARAAVCTNGCITGELRRTIAVLGDRSRPSVQRLQALEEVEHFVGDLHQPLHLTDNDDRGGNAVTVTAPGRGSPTNLHAFWDNDLVRQAVGSDPAAAVDALRPRIQAHAAEWRRGDIAGWAAETHQIGVRFAYADLPLPPTCHQVAAPQQIPVGYAQKATPVVADQLGKAAVRLAAVLNQTLK